jgi:hypothetical protein
MKIGILILLLSRTLFAAEITLQPGETLTLKPNEETTVTCAGKPSKPKAQKCAWPASDEACKGLENGDLCRKDESKGTCVGQKGLHGFECKCVL